MTRQKTIILSIAIVLIIAGLLVWQTYSIVNEESEAELHVAVLLPLSGIGAAVGNDFLQGMNLALQEKENKKIVYHIEDTQTSPKEAVNALNKLFAEEDIDLVVALQAQVIAPVASITESKNIALLASLASIENLTRVNDDVTLFYPLPEDEMKKIIEFIEVKKYQRIATITVMDEFGQTMKQKMIKEYGERIVASESYPIAESDYKTYLTKIKESQPDIIFVIGYPPHLINILKQRVELGMDTIPIISTMHMQSNFVRSATSNLMNEVYAVAPLTLVKENEEFVLEFKEKFQREPDFMAPFGYDVVKIIDAASESNKDSVSEKIRESSIKGISGRVSFNRYGEVNMPLGIVKAANREIIIS